MPTAADLEDPCHRVDCCKMDEPDGNERSTADSPGFETKRSLFFSLFVNAAREKKHLQTLLHLDALYRRLPRYSRMIWHLPVQREIVKLLKDEVLSSLARLQPVFPFKFLHELLLCQGMSSRDRARCLVHNFRFIRAAVQPATLQEILSGQSCVLFDRTKDGHRVSIVFCLSNFFYLEGEMSLLLKVDDRSVFNLAFTIVPGDVVDAAAKDVILSLGCKATKDNTRPFVLPRKYSTASRLQSPPLRRYRDWPDRSA